MSVHPYRKPSTDQSKGAPQVQCGESMSPLGILPGRRMRGHLLEVNPGAPCGTCRRLYIGGCPFQGVQQVFPSPRLCCSLLPGSSACLRAALISHSGLQAALSLSTPGMEQSRELGKLRHSLALRHKHGDPT